MTALTSLTWDDVPRPIRVLARWITIAQAAGYGVSIAFARETVGKFRSGGNIDTHELLLSAHSHLLSMTALFALSGFCFALGTIPREPLKSWVLRAPFVAILVGFTAVWLAKYWAPLVWMLVACQLLMAVAFYWQIIVTMRELRRVRRADAALEAPAN